MNITTSNIKKYGFLKSLLLFGGLAILVLLVQALLSYALDILIVQKGITGFPPPLDLQLFFAKVAIFGMFALFYRFDRIKIFFYLAGAIFFIFFCIMAISNYIVPDLASQNELLITLSYWLPDLWPMVMFSLLFWVAANQRFTTKQASIAYPFFVILASLGMIFGNLLSNYLQEISIIYAVISISILFIIALCFFLFNETQINLEIVNNQPIIPIQKIIYLSFLALIFICGDIVNQGLNFTLKISARYAFSDFNSYNDFMATISYLQAIIAVIVAFMTCWFVWAFGWRIGALIIPIACLLLLAVYVHAESNPKAYERLTSLVEGFPQASAPVLIISLFTAVFKGLSVIFLTTKQMAFIPLPSSTKARGNAFLAIFLGGQVVSTFLFTLSLVIFRHAEGTQGFIYPVFIASVVWITAVLLLAKRFESLNSKNTT